MLSSNSLLPLTVDHEINIIAIAAMNDIIFSLD